MTIQWIARPALRRPVLVAAFQGWNDAGNAASDAVRWLGRRFDAQPAATLDAEDYVDFQAARPNVELVNGVVREVEWPTLSVSSATVGERDVLLVQGVEPNLRWRAFCDDVLSIARELGAELAVTLGALLGDIPHSRPVRCTGSATDEVMAARLGMQRSRYEGPTGIVGVLHDAFRRAGFESASVWAPVPHYVATPPNPKATRALLERLAQLVDLPLDLTDLDIAAAAWERSVADVVAGDADVMSYVAGLESRYDAALDSPFADDDDDEDEFADESEEEEEEEEDWFDEDELPSGETLARDFEQYLRDQDDDT